MKTTGVRSVALARSICSSVADGTAVMGAAVRTFLPLEANTDEGICATLS
jgi:hypothetical protein